MAITVVCGACGKSYNLKDEMDGKKIRCKECSAVIPVHSKSDDDWDEAEEDYRPPPRKTSKKTKKGIEFGGRPLTVWIAIACVVVMALLSLGAVVMGAFGTVMPLRQLSEVTRRAIIVLPYLIALILQGVVLFGLLSGNAGVRILAIVLAGLAILFWGGMFLIAISSGDLLSIMMYAMPLGLRVSVIGCLLTPSAGRYFNR